MEVRARPQGRAALREGWAIQHQFTDTAVWPGSVESHMAAAKVEQYVQMDEGRIEARGRSARRRRAVGGQGHRVVRARVHAPDRSAFRRCSIFQITFGACGYETRVWLNGHQLRTIEGEEVHYGE